MKSYQVLVLTDPTRHSKENSLYPLLNAMLRHPLTAGIDVASRKNAVNARFFRGESAANLWVSEVYENFSFSEKGGELSDKLKKADPGDYDLIWLRLPPPLDLSFLEFIDRTFSGKFIINSPKGIYQTGTKAFLLNFPSLCPPLQLCRTKAEIRSFAEQFPIVLKPVRGYGGEGIVRIDGNRVWEGQEEMTLEEYFSELKDGSFELLAAKFLKNVSQGDKRIIVVNGKIMGASLRLPTEDSWLCNVAMGGTSHLAKVEPQEEKIVAAINPLLSKMGIVMYGVDTLVGDDGKRILSEINTTSIGGLPQIAAQMELPLVEEAIDLIWSYFINQKTDAKEY
jgi:glutathione synthase